MGDDIDAQVPCDARSRRIRQHREVRRGHYVRELGRDGRIVREDLRVVREPFQRLAYRVAPSVHSVLRSQAFRGDSVDERVEIDLLIGVNERH